MSVRFFVAILTFFRLTQLSFFFFAVCIVLRVASSNANKVSHNASWPGSSLNGATLSQIGLSSDSIWNPSLKFLSKDCTADPSLTRLNTTPKILNALLRSVDFVHPMHMYRYQSQVDVSLLSYSEFILHDVREQYYHSTRTK